jgi:hypothetical protein
VVEEFALDEAVRVVTELAAEVFLPEVEAAALAPVVVADPWTYRLSSFLGSFWNVGRASRMTWYWFDWV